jgi:hypothetical protein
MRYRYWVRHLISEDKYWCLSKYRNIDLSWTRCIGVTTPTW